MAMAPTCGGPAYRGNNAPNKDQPLTDRVHVFDAYALARKIIVSVGFGRGSPRDGEVTWDWKLFGTFLGRFSRRTRCLRECKVFAEFKIVIVRS